MFRCPTCNTSFEIVIGTNICPKCEHTVIVKSAKQINLVEIPISPGSLSAIALAKSLSKFIDNPAEVMIVARILGIHPNVCIDSQNLSSSLYSLSETIKSFFNDEQWEGAGRPKFIEWLEFKQTTSQEVVFSSHFSYLQMSNILSFIDYRIVLCYNTNAHKNIKEKR